MFGAAVLVVSLAAERCHEVFRVRIVPQYHPVSQCTLVF